MYTTTRMMPIVLAAALLTIPTVAQDSSNANRAEALALEAAPELRQRIADQKDLGLIIGVIDGEHQHVAGYGRISTDEDAPAPDAHTRFEVGSVTKAFTGLILASLVADEELRLEDPIEAMLRPDVVERIGTNKEITLRELATHTSGLPRNLAFIPNGGYSDVIHELNPEAVYDYLSGYDSRPTRGQKTYSNGGMELLGHLLSVYMGESYDALLASRVLAPLSMKETTVTIPRGEGIVAATGHTRSDDRFVATEDFYNAFSPASGAISSTMADMMRLVDALLHPDRCASKEFIEVIELNLAFQAGDVDGPGNAIAWGRFPWKGMVLYDHDGQTFGFKSFVLFSRDKDRGVVLFSNTASSLEEIQRFKSIAFDIMARPKGGEQKGR